MKRTNGQVCWSAVGERSDEVVAVKRTNGQVCWSAVGVRSEEVVAVKRTNGQVCWSAVGERSEEENRLVSCRLCYITWPGRHNNYTDHPASCEYLKFIMSTFIIICSLTS